MLHSPVKQIGSAPLSTGSAGSFFLLFTGGGCQCQRIFISVSPDPFDSSTGARLERMGILRPDGEVNVEVMRAFVQIFGGLFFDDLCDFYSDQGEVSAVTAAFSELAARKDCQNIYLLISLQYDTIRKPLPDPIWWLAGCAPALSLFCLGFCRTASGTVGKSGQQREGDGCQ